VTRVLLIDDHPIVLQGCKKLLEDAGADEVDQAQSASEGFRVYRQKKPDVIVIDLAMQAGALSGLSFLRRLRRIDTETPVLVLTMHRDPMIVGRALELGASGYVLKDAPPEEVVRAFQRVRTGQQFISHDLASDVVFTRLREKVNRLERLTPRELQTLTLVAEGKPYGEIAEELNVSYKTVANICTQLKTKLGARSRPELMRIAIQYLPESAKFSTIVRERSRRGEPYDEL
jgi:two-component system, NarL family, invasion response regulator UvrY